MKKNKTDLNKSTSLKSSLNNSTFNTQHSTFVPHDPVSHVPVPYDEEQL